MATFSNDQPPREATVRVRIMLGDPPESLIPDSLILDALRRFGSTPAAYEYLRTSLDY